MVFKNEATIAYPGSRKVSIYYTEGDRLFYPQTRMESDYHSNMTRTLRLRNTIFLNIPRTMETVTRYGSCLGMHPS